MHPSFKHSIRWVAYTVIFLKFNNTNRSQLDCDTPGKRGLENRETAQDQPRYRSRHIDLQPTYTAEKHNRKNVFEELFSSLE